MGSCTGNGGVCHMLKDVLNSFHPSQDQNKDR